MVLKTDKLKVLSTRDADLKKLHDLKLPGFEKIKDPVMIDFLIENVGRPNLCQQVIETGVLSKVVSDENDDIVAAYGWKVLEILGRGKDGITFWGHKYLDKKEHVVKFTSVYAKNFQNHSEIFNFMLKTLSAQGTVRNSMLIDQSIKNQYSFYYAKKPFVHIAQNSTMLHEYIAQVCNMNEWMIEHTGFLFWDLGYANGRNFMLDEKRRLKWVDYGGAGLLRCPNFDKIYQPMEKQGGPVLSQLEVNGRQSLCTADSNFVMLQFLLNYEWHACKDKRSTPVDTISSMLQVKRSIIPLMVDILPKLLHTNFTRTIFEQYKKSNWCDYTTWRSIKNNIRNTKFG